MSIGYWEVALAGLIPGIVYAAWVDYAQRRVPNWLNAAIAAAGFIAQGYFCGLHGLGMGFAGLGVGLAVLIVPWLMHGMGAGDVKLMMAIGVWLGPYATFLAFCVGAIVGGIIAAVMILSTGRFWNACANLITITQKVSNRATVFSEFGSAKSFGSTSQLLPYGVPLTFGTMIVFFSRVWIG